MTIQVEQAIVLAAGRGSRMGGLTTDKPKCLTALAGKRLLDWQLSALRAAGVTEITVIRGYRKELLSDPGYAVLDNDNWANTNMVATLHCAAPLLRQSHCVVSYSDIVYHPSIVRSLAESDGDISIAYDVFWSDLWKARFDDVLADAETFKQKNGWLETIGERAKTMGEIEGQYMGLLKFSPHGWSQTEELLLALSPEARNRLDMTSLLRMLLNEGVAIRCIPVPGHWCEVDSVSDAHAYERILDEAGAGNARWQHDWRW